ncbi:hypothetical protein [Streptomyces sp. NPDC000405]|uniref:hypothetical protein n=1 Tax=Streptomyces sp. NPDC000405 TaxID=3161033 RepID=UPI00398CA3B9
MEEIGTDGQLSDEELEQFRRLMHRFCSHDLDQWEAWQMGTPHGPVYITLSRALPPNVDAEAYRRL